MKIRPEETELVGTWQVSQAGVAADSVSQRIQSLIDSYLIELGSDASGWDVLYEDPADGRLWHLSYPQSSEHGGGPPKLEVVDIETAKRKFGTVAVRSQPAKR